MQETKGLLHTSFEKGDARTLRSRSEGGEAALETVPSMLAPILCSTYSARQGRRQSSRPRPVPSTSVSVEGSLSERRGQGRGQTPRRAVLYCQVVATAAAPAALFSSVVCPQCRAEASRLLAAVAVEQSVAPPAQGCGRVCTTYSWPPAKQPSTSCAGNRGGAGRGRVQPTSPGAAQHWPHCSQRQTEVVAETVTERSHHLYKTQPRGAELRSPGPRQTRAPAGGPPP